MTLLEKAKEMGLKMDLSGDAAEGCPCEHGLTSVENDNAYCETHNCIECYAREYVDPTATEIKITCISGKAGHGKDTTAIFMKEFLEERGQRVLITHYGDLVKYIAKTFFGWDGNKDEAGRSLLQRIGTDEIRAKCPNYWTDFVKGIVKMFPAEWDHVLIPDCRFPNEVECFMEAGFDAVHIRVIRAPFVSPLTLEQQMHPSETALDGVRADKYLLNTGTLEDYRRTVRNWLAGKHSEG